MFAIELINATRYGLMHDIYIMYVYRLKSETLSVTCHIQLSYVTTSMYTLTMAITLFYWLTHVVWYDSKLCWIFVVHVMYNHNYSYIPCWLVSATARHYMVLDRRCFDGFVGDIPKKHPCDRKALHLLNQRFRTRQLQNSMYVQKCTKLWFEHALR